MLITILYIKYHTFLIHTQIVSLLGMNYKWFQGQDFIGQEKRVKIVEE